MLFGCRTVTLLLALLLFGTKDYTWQKCDVSLLSLLVDHILSTVAVCLFQNGVLECTMETCQLPMCESPIKIPGQCCPVCH